MRGDRIYTSEGGEMVRSDRQLETRLASTYRIREELCDGEDTDRRINNRMNDTIDTSMNELDLRPWKI